MSRVPLLESLGSNSGSEETFRSTRQLLELGSADVPDRALLVHGEY